MQKGDKQVLFGYCRESIDLKSGCKIQQDAIERYCTAYDYDLAYTFIDNDASAYKFRPAFDELWSKIDKCDGIIVNDLTRFGRSFPELLAHLTYLKENNKTLILIKEGINSSHPESEFFLKLLALFAERERLIIKERLAAGIEYAKKNGTKSGKPMHRPRTKIDFKRVDKYLEAGLGIASIAKLIGVSSNILYRQINERKLKQNNA